MKSTNIVHKSKNSQENIIFNPYACSRVNHSLGKMRKKRRRSIAEPYINVIIDSGASRHCCNNLDIMSNIRKTNVNIMVGNGTIIRASKMGDIGCVKDILYLPEINHFLFSISYFLNTNSNLSVEFSNSSFSIKDDRKILGRGTLSGSNLYLLKMRLPKKLGGYIDAN